MPCSLSQSSSPHIMKDPWVLESQWEFTIHRYQHLLHFQLCKRYSAGHFIHFLIKIVTQLPAAHTKLRSQLLSHTKSSLDRSLSAMAHSSSVVPPPSKPTHGHCKTVLSHKYTAINRLTDTASLWPLPTENRDLKVSKGEGGFKSQDEATRLQQQQQQPSCTPPTLFKIL